MNSKLCTYINTFTNIFALIPIWKYIVKRDYVGAVLCSCSLVASIGMHISETKHKLPGVHFKKYSNLLLNIDRFFAYLLFEYAVYKFFTKPVIPSLLEPVAMLGTAVVSVVIGERTEDLTLYTVMHTIWHALSYGTLAYTI